MMEWRWVPCSLTSGLPAPFTTLAHIRGCLVVKGLMADDEACQKRHRSKRNSLHPSQRLRKKEGVGVKKRANILRIYADIIIRKVECWDTWNPKRVDRLNSLSLRSHIETQKEKARWEGESQLRDLTSFLEDWSGSQGRRKQQVLISSSSYM